MKRLLIVGVSFVVLVFTVSPALSIQYCKDVLEPGNPGGWGTSAKTWDDEITAAVTEEVYVDIWLNDCPEEIFSSGFWITYDPERVSVESVDAYDNNEFPGPWESYWTMHYPGPVPGTYQFIVTNFTYCLPDTDGDIILGRVKLRCLAEGDASITIMSIPTYSTTVGISATVYDPQITPNTITIHQVILPCCTHISPDPEKVFAGETIQFTGVKKGTCISPYYVWSDDCEHAEIDPVTGVLTIEAIETEEVCSVCVTDLANQSSCTGAECDPPADCCANFIITNDVDDDGIADDEDNCPNHPNGPDLGTCIYGSAIGQACSDNQECGAGGFCSMDQEDNFPVGGNGIGEACECEGDFDADGDCDGTDAVTFKADFGRSNFSNPCPTQ